MILKRIEINNSYQSFTKNENCDFITEKSNVLFPRKR